MKMHVVFAAGLAGLAVSWQAVGGAQAAPLQPDAATNITRDAGAGGLIHQAQFTIQFGSSDGKLRRKLREAGYSEIEITKRGFKSNRANACIDGVRYALKMSSSGRVRNRSRIGRCRSLVTIEQAQTILEREGYKRIVIEENGSVPYIAIACLRRDRFRVRINKHGEIIGTRNLGRCQKRLRPDDVAAKLRDEGYNRIRFTDRQLPRYVAEACNRSNRKIELRLNRFGEIQRKRRVGRCEPPVRARDIPRLLADRGLDRIEMIRSKPPRYRAEACRGTDRVELIVGRFGGIRREEKVGRCASPLSQDQLARAMRDNGYTYVRFAELAGGRARGPDDNYSTTACRKQSRLQLTFNRFGELVEKKELNGRCVSPQIGNVLERLNDRGLRRVRIYAEGCRNGRKLRFEIDPFFGTRSNRERIGSC